MVVQKGELIPVYLWQVVVLRQQPLRRLLQVLKAATGIMFGTIQIYWPLITRRVAGRVLKRGVNLITQIQGSMKGGQLVRLLQVGPVEITAIFAGTTSVLSFRTAHDDGDQVQ